MNDNFMPLITAHGILGENGASVIFITPREKVTIHGYATSILEIVRWCNGHRTLAEIAFLSKVDEQTVEALTKVLVNKGILRDSRELYQAALIDSSYPLVATYDRSPDEIQQLVAEPTIAARILGKEIFLSEPCKSAVIDVATRRQSCRGFSDLPIHHEEISALLRVMYGKQEHRPVPSAGSLYALDLYLLILKPTQDIPEGLYWYNPERHALVLRRNDVPLIEANMLLDSSSILKGAAGVVFIAADTQRSARKYANRAYRYVLLESGHLAQNAYLYCAERGIGIVEYGGFNDEVVAAFLGLQYPKQSVTITLVMGKPEWEKAKEFVEEFAAEERELRRALVGIGKPITSFGVNVHSYRQYRFPRYVGWAAYVSPDTSTRNRNLHRSTGLGSSMQEAALKALAEGFERHCSGLVRIDRIAHEDQLDGPVLDLCTAAPLREEYLERAGLAVRDTSTPTEWVRGASVVDDSPVYVPVDQVYYPLPARGIDRRLTYVANSTGIAVHPDSRVAFEKGLCELVERDSIAVCWYAKRVPKKIAHCLLSRDVQKRIERIERALRREVHLLDLTLDSIPVIGCVIRGSTYPRITSGFGCSFNVGEAVEKSIDEAEVIFHTWRRNPRRGKDLPVTRVYSVTDHLHFWALRANQPEIDWLLSGEETHILPKPTGTLSSIINRFRLIRIDLTPKDNPSTLKVIKVCSPVLMPITFGYMAEHYGHPRVHDLGYGWEWKYPALPHFLA